MVVVMVPTNLSWCIAKMGIIASKVTHLRNALTGVRTFSRGDLPRALLGVLGWLARSDLMIALMCTVNFLVMSRTRRNLDGENNFVDSGVI